MRMEHGLTSYDFSDLITHHQPTADSDLGNGGNGVISDQSRSIYPGKLANFAALDRAVFTSATSLLRFFFFFPHFSRLFLFVFFNVFLTQT